MPNLKSIFENPKYQLPIIFKTDNFANEVNKLLASYIVDLREKKVSRNVSLLLTKRGSP